MGRGGEGRGLSGGGWGEGLGRGACGGGAERELWGRVRL